MIKEVVAEMFGRMFKWIIIIVAVVAVIFFTIGALFF